MTFFLLVLVCKNSHTGTIFPSFIYLSLRTHRSPIAHRWRSFSLAPWFDFPAVLPASPAKTPCLPCAHKNILKRYLLYSAFSFWNSLPASLLATSTVQSLKAYFHDWSCRHIHALFASLSSQSSFSAYLISCILSLSVIVLTLCTSLILVYWDE